MTIQSRSKRTFFSGDNIATTGFIYNSLGENSSTTGWFDCSSDNILVRVGCATKLSSGNLVYKIEGKFEKPEIDDRVASITLGSFVSANPIDRLITVNEHIKSIRVGVKVNIVSTPLGSPTNFYSSLFLTDIN